MKVYRIQNEAGEFHRGGEWPRFYGTSNGKLYSRISDARRVRTKLMSHNYRPVDCTIIEYELGEGTEVQ